MVGAISPSAVKDDSLLPHETIIASKCTGRNLLADRLRMNQSNGVGHQFSTVFTNLAMVGYHRPSMSTWGMYQVLASRRFLGELSNRYGDVTGKVRVTITPGASSSATN